MGENKNLSSCGLARLIRLSLMTCVFVILTVVLGTSSVYAEQGVSDSLIRIGGVMDLEGRSKGLGQGMKHGIEAAIKGETIQGRRIEFIVYDDSYTPTKTISATNQLLSRDVFLVIGNVGTPTAKVALPILAEKRVPAVGFFTGAGILRPGIGDIVNYRASYVQETAKVIEAAIQAGVPSSGICAYVQDDAYGMAGVTGIKQALSSRPGTRKIIAALDQILDLEGEKSSRNGLGPVGVYRRNTFTSRDGYNSLKQWEGKTGAKCQLVVSVGTYNAIARFVGYSRYKGDTWTVSAVSFTGADDFRTALKEFHVADNVVMTQVVPALDSSLPIVREARKALGAEFGYVSLEGFIVGKMWLAAMRGIEGPITRENFMRSVKGRTFDVGGLQLDFRDDNQGSDLVLLTYLDGEEYRVLQPGAWRDVLRAR